LALGSILGAIGFLRIALWAVFFNVYGEHWFWVALTVGLALIAIVLWGTLAGSMLPFVMRRLGFRSDNVFSALCGDVGWM